MTDERGQQLTTPVYNSFVIYFYDYVQMWRLLALSYHLMVVYGSRHRLHCGKRVGDMCCTCPWNSASKVDICTWDSDHMWCILPNECDLMSGRCKHKYDSTGACGFVTEPCCVGHCSDQLLCASGKCVDTRMWV